MGRPAGWMKELTGRSPMKSPVRRGIVGRLSGVSGVRSQRGDERGGWGACWGGIPGWLPVVPPWWGMSPMNLDEPTGRFLSFREREEIACCASRGVGVRAIARQLGRDPSTISRELRRNAATRGGKLDYRASVAQWKADLVARRPKAAKLAVDDRLRDYVQERLTGHVQRPDGTVVAGPTTGPWKGRGKPHRQDRRWVAA